MKIQLLILTFFTITIFLSIYIYKLLNYYHDLETKYYTLKERLSELDTTIMSEIDNHKIRLQNLEEDLYVHLDKNNIKNQ